jgi:hypothetical protein
MATREFLRLLMGNERYDDRQHFEQIVLLDRPNVATTVNGDRERDDEREREGNTDSMHTVRRNHGKGND